MLTLTPAQAGDLGAALDDAARAAHAVADGLEQHLDLEAAVE